MPESANVLTVIATIKLAQFGIGVALLVIPTLEPAIRKTLHERYDALSSVDGGRNDWRHVLDRRE